LFGLTRISDDRKFGARALMTRKLFLDVLKLFLDVLNIRDLSPSRSGFAKLICDGGCLLAAQARGRDYG